MIRNCKWCGRKFESKHGRLYCSDACREDRQRVYRKWMDQYDGRHWDDREELFKIWLKRNGYGRA